MRKPNKLATTSVPAGAKRPILLEPAQLDRVVGGGIDGTHNQQPDDTFPFAR